MRVKFFEDNTYGFFDETIHGPLDDNYIEITEEAYQELIQNQGVKTLSETAKTLPKIDLRSVVDIPLAEPTQQPPTTEERIEALEMALLSLL